MENIRFLIDLFLGAFSIAFTRFVGVLAENSWLTGQYEHLIELSHQLDVVVESLSSNGTATVDGVTVDNSTMLSLPPIPSINPAILKPFQLGNGEWWYVGLMAGAGFAAGLIKVLWTKIFRRHPFPDKIAGFVKEIADLESHDPLLAIPVLLSACISLGFGASIGPKAPLGCTGTSFGTSISKRWSIGSYRAKVNVNITQQQKDNNDANSPHASTKGLNLHKESALGESVPSSKAVVDQEVIVEREEAETDADTKNSCLHKVASAILPDFSNRKSICVLDGMATSFGAIFP